MKQKSPATLKRIAEQLGISVTTVSRALTGQARRYRIGRETEQRVQELARSLGFSPNRLARGLRLNRSSTIGVLIPDVSNPFFAGIVRQIALGARERHYSIIVCDSQDSEDIEIESLALLRSHNVEGIVLCPVGLSADHLLQFVEGDIPLVLADRYFPGLRLPYVASDNFAGAREATAHLIRNGHRRIACLQGLRGTSPNEDRLRGYREALASHQIPVNESLIAGDCFGEQSGYVATKLLLKSASGFTAIFAFSNLISLGAMRALSEEGVRVPDDVSVVSFDDQPYLPHLAAPMTVVAQSAAEMGQIAVKLLFDHIQEPQRTVPGGILLPTTLISRGSVRNLDESPSERTQRHVCG
ncbi:MAG: LacI family transcriptional regulator [Planctomycetaceae bacterium]|nr:LacI family transcriptional regulator [Planctomycetaceae bacterium]